MKDYLIEFQKMDWERTAPGIRFKAHVMGDRKLRLVEFTDEFDEGGWCTKGHTGFIIEGRVVIDINGRKVTFNEGDGLFIPEGDEDKHSATVPEGEKALIIMFEKA